MRLILSLLIIITMTVPVAAGDFSIKGSAIIGGLVSRALIRVDLKGDTAEEAERFKWGERIREIEQGPEGALYVLEDGSGGRLLKLTPSR